MDDPVLRGSCLCGDISYTSSSLPTDLSLCHCKNCRRHSGSAFSAWHDLHTSSLIIRAGHAMLEQVSDLAKRSSCSQCGTPLFMQYHCEPDIVGVAVGTIDEDSLTEQLRGPSNHIFVAEKASWFNIPNDGLPRYETFSPEFMKMLDAWRNNQSSKGKP